ncbi:MAG: TetR/AcrR family transcriptional regulator [Campylobacter sp.]|nr:TetR/AcrR family transcriptional regulator [Campylobacter sp.]
MSKNERAKLKKSRMIKYFIDAANQIIAKDGIRAVNIRNTANLAGYSSATLYNYFDNLTHLVFLATFNQLEEYNKAVSTYISNCSNSIEVYMKVCKCFCDYSYEKPEIYELLFFAHNDGKFDNYIEEYYKLFPNKDNKKLPKFLNSMFKSNDLHKRSYSMLENCINDGYIDRLEVDDFNDICLRFNKTILQDVKDKILSKDEATKITLRYYYQLFRCCINEKYRYILDDCYKDLLNS